MTDEDDDARPVLQHVEEWDGGFSWIAHPDENAQRASHALLTAAGVWVVEPVDASGLDDQLDELGTVTGVLVVHDRHTRDAETVADRHDVPVYVPDWMTLTPEKLTRTPEPVGLELPGTDYTVHRLIETDEWEEALLVNQSMNTLLVPEAIGASPGFREDDTPLGVHPGLEDPPERLSEYSPDRILVGHGPSIHSDASATLRTLLSAE